MTSISSSVVSSLKKSDDVHNDDRVASGNEPHLDHFHGAACWQRHWPALEMLAVNGGTARRTTMHIDDGRRSQQAC